MKRKERLRLFIYLGMWLIIERKRFEFENENGLMAGFFVKNREENVVHMVGTT